MIIPAHRPLPDYTQHSQETDINAPGRIRTRIPSKQAAAHPFLRLRDITITYYTIVTTATITTKLLLLLLFIFIFLFVVCFPGVTTHCGCIFTAR